MEVRTAYCATCDRPVRVLVKDETIDPVNMDDVICLEHGDTCTGAMCPIFDVPSDEMKEQLEAYRREAEGAEGKGTP